MNETIRIKGAKEHNLQNVDLEIPRDKMVVFTGLSGSGKSSLAFDTIYAEGQRRYMESLSSYARQFLGLMEKPDVEQIDGLSPAISIDQKTTSKNPRSTVGTVTEIHDYLRLLYARIGIPHCPVCGREIQSQSVDQIADRILALPEGTRVTLLAPVIRAQKGTHEKVLERIRRDGFVRVRVDGEIRNLGEDEIKLEKTCKHTIEIVTDRIVVRAGAESRLAESIELSIANGDGLVRVYIQPVKPKNEEEIGVLRELAGEGTKQGKADGQRTETEEERMTASSGKPGKDGTEQESSEPYEQTFSTRLACPEHGTSLEELEPRMFSFNSPFGACPKCAGLGFTQHIDPERLVEPELSLMDGALATVFGNLKTTNYMRAALTGLAGEYGADLVTPWKDLPEKLRYEILNGTGGRVVEFPYVSKYTGSRSVQRWAFEGAIANLERRMNETNSDYIQDKISQYLVTDPCPACHGKRLKPEILAVTVGGKNIVEFSDMAVREEIAFLDSLRLSERETAISAQILKEIRARLKFLMDVGLDYLTLSRASGTLSGGEAQRIRLATQIGSGLTGVLYILDEPSIGLHQKDNAKLLKSLRGLTNLGNTLIVVEHDEETMYEADYIVDIGPGAGVNGGKVIAAGTVEDIKACRESITGQYLRGDKKIALPEARRPGNGKEIVIRGAREHNLRNIDVHVPLGKLVVVTGVSGSGKSSLINEILVKALSKELYHSMDRPGDFDRVEGLENLDKIISIDQSPIGKTPRSNPATYTGVFDQIRSLFAQTPEAKLRGYEKGRFSFNIRGGRCESCSGDGIIKIEMHFLSDVYVPCEVCHGKRYNRETLEVKYKGKSISDVLEMTVSQALAFFQNVPSIERQLRTLEEVGLGYIALGQPSTQLSGGEAQRVKLATELSRRATGRTIYVLDEPTTGLHFDDVNKLVQVLEKLVDGGNTVVVIEHNLDVIKMADWIIDLGPDGGDKGGSIVATGTPEDVAKVKESYTGQYLAKILGAGK